MPSGTTPLWHKYCKYWKEILEGRTAAETGDADASVQRDRQPPNAGQGDGHRHMAMFQACFSADWYKGKKMLTRNQSEFL